MKAICQHGSLTFNILNQFIKLQEKVPVVHMVEKQEPLANDEVFISRNPPSRFPKPFFLWAASGPWASGLPP